jgi:ligand-binding sensor domain-containing protein/two-component sensor histidine kinase
MYKYFYILLCSGCLCNLSAFAQPIQCTQYTLTDGLVGNNIRKIIQDQQGFIWIATWDGLCRFDGYRFTNYTTREGLTANFISDMIEVEPGTLLVAPWQKKLMQIVNGAIKSGTNFSHALITSFLKTNAGELLALSLDSGVLKWQNGKFIPLFPDAPTKLDDLIKLNDTLFAGLNNTSIWLLNKKFNTIGPDQNPKTKEYHSFFRDNHQNIWVNTNKGIALLSKEQQQATPVRFQPLPPWMAKTLVGSTYTRSMLHDKSGKYWVGNDAGLFYLDSSGYNYHFTTANGLPTNIVTSLMQDRENNIWVGTSTGVVKIALKNNFRFIKASDGLPIALVHHLLPINKEKAMLFSNGKSWLGLRNGHIDIFETFKPGWKRHFKTAEDEVLIMRNAHVEIYRDGTNVPAIRKWSGETQPFLISRIEKDSYFIGKQLGFEFETPEGVFVDSTSIPYRISTGVADHNSNLWVGTWSHGVYLVKWHRKNRKFTWETKKIPDNLFLNNEVRSMYMDKDNRLWVGSRHGGVVCLQMENEHIRMVHAFSNQDLLSSNFVGAVKEDNKKNIWIGTGHGLVKLIPTDTGYRSFNFSRIHHAPIAINQINFLSGNRLVASGIDGLIMANDDEVDTLPPPACFITEIITPGQSPPKNYRDPYKLHYENPNIIFQFTAPVYFNEKMVAFSYRLKGNGDTLWMTSSRDRSVNFASLSPGNYRFEVRASGWNGAWGKPATFSFSVSTPFWQQWWFIALIVLAVSGIIFALYRYRINQIMQLQKVRDSIAADLHDDIGSTLTNINILSDLSKKNIDLPEKAGTFIDRIGTEVHDLQESLDDIIWSVNTRNDTLEETVYRMRRYAAELFDAGDVNYAIDISDWQGVQKLGMQQRRDLYLLFKECINNIYKHAEARNVQISMALSGQQLTMKIQDDGKGFDKHSATKRNGLKNLKKRVDKWEGNIEINSTPGKGTIIQIIFPIVMD